MSFSRFHATYFPRGVSRLARNNLLTIGPYLKRLIKYITLFYDLQVFLFNGCGSRIWTYDLRVMSPTSYQTAPSRAILSSKLDFFWCRGPESNRYDVWPSQDFKSCASACSATPAYICKSLVFGFYFLLILIITLPLFWLCQSTSFDPAGAPHGPSLSRAGFFGIF